MKKMTLILFGIETQIINYQNNSILYANIVKQNNILH